MSAIVQHKSGAFQSSLAELTFDSPVTKGNMIVVAVSSYGYNPTAADVSDGVNRYALAVQELGSAGHSSAFIFNSTAQGTGSLTVALTGSTHETIWGLHIYEVAGYNTVDQVGGFTNVEETTTSSVSTNGSTAIANEFCLALFTGDSGTTWTAQDGAEGYEIEDPSGDNLGVSFSEGFEVTELGIVTATATCSPLDLLSPGVIATFYLGSGNVYNPDPPFIGSVTEVDSAPSGNSDPFLGTVTVIESAPAGVPNPYLGAVRIGTPSGSQPNPALGQVVVIGSAPAGNASPYLGTVETD